MHHSQPAAVETKLPEGQLCWPQWGRKGGRAGGVKFVPLREKPGNPSPICLSRSEILLSGDGEQLPTGFSGLWKAWDGICNAFYCCLLVFIGSSSFVLRDLKGSLKWISTKVSFICKQFISVRINWVFCKHHYISNSILSDKMAINFLSIDSFPWYILVAFSGWKERPE